MELAHVGRLQPRGDVPVDVTHVVVQLVLAEIGEIEAEGAEQRAVVALQQAVEAAYHRPLEPAQDGVGVLPPGRRAAGGDGAQAPRVLLDPAATRTWVSSGFSGAGTACMIRATSSSAVFASESAS